MEGLSAGKGKQLLELIELQNIPVPVPTPTYTPVPHFDLSNSIRTIGQDLLTDCQIIKEQYAVARQGNQLFAVLIFRAEHSERNRIDDIENYCSKIFEKGRVAGVDLEETTLCPNCARQGQRFQN